MPIGDNIVAKYSGKKFINEYITYKQINKMVENLFNVGGQGGGRHSSPLEIILPPLNNESEGNAALIIILVIETHLLFHLNYV